MSKRRWHDINHGTFYTDDRSWSRVKLIHLLFCVCKFIFVLEICRHFGYFTLLILILYSGWCLELYVSCMTLLLHYFVWYVVVQNSPRLGSLSEIYAEIIISAHGYPNGILQLSNNSIHVPDGYVGPLLYVTRTDGLLGQVRFSFFLPSYLPSVVIIPVIIIMIQQQGTVTCELYKQFQQRSYYYCLLLWARSTM